MTWQEGWGIGVDTNLALAKLSPHNVRAIAAQEKGVAEPTIILDKWKNDLCCLQTLTVIISQMLSLQRCSDWVE